MNIIKFFIKSMFSFIKFIQFLLFVFAGLTIFYFIITSLKYNLPAPISNFFSLVYEIQKGFFHPSWIVIFKVDFTLVLFSLEIMVLSCLLYFTEDFFLSLEYSFDRVEIYNNIQSEKKFNKKLSKNIKKREVSHKDIKLVGAFNITLKNTGILRIENEVLENTTLQYCLKLGKLLKQNFNIDLNKDNNMFIISTNEFKNVDEILDTIIKYGISAKADAKKNNFHLEIYSVISVANKQDTFADFLPVLKKLMELSSTNKIITKLDFKIEYDLLSKKTYNFSSMGTYVIADKMDEIFYLVKNNN